MYSSVAEKQQEQLKQNRNDLHGRVSFYNMTAAMSDVANHRHMCWFIERNGQSEAFTMKKHLLTAQKKVT